MRAILLLSLLITAPRTYGQDLLDWSARRSIEWKDFKGFVPERPEHDAYTAYRIMASYAIDDRGAITWEVRCVFDRDHAWATAEGKKNAVLLGHEGLHFDIAEVHARELRARLAGGAMVGDVNIQHQLKALLDSTIAQATREQGRYDLATDHGRNTEAQALWEAEVSQRLTALADHSAEALARRRREER